jgi:hypothetical protein
MKGISKAAHAGLSPLIPAVLAPPEMLVQAPQGFIPSPLNPSGARLETKELAPGIYGLLSSKPPVDNSGFVVGDSWRPGDRRAHQWNDGRADPNRRAAGNQQTHPLRGQHQLPWRPHVRELRLPPGDAATVLHLKPDLHDRVDMSARYSSWRPRIAAIVVAFMIPKF